MPRPNDGLSESQLKVLKYLRGFHSRNGYYATVRDIQRYMGWSTPSSAFQTLKQLEEKGRVKKMRVTRDRSVFITVE